MPVVGLSGFRSLLVALVVLAATVAAGCASSPRGPAAAGAAGGGAPLSASPDALALERDFVQVQPSVVQITTDRGLGSGVVFDDKGNVVTNAHVIAGASQFHVRLANSPTLYPASLVGAYPPDDVAVVHLDSPPPGLRPARFADSSIVQPGAIVLAMGNPLGLTGSVTNGIVSATGRAVSEPAAADSSGATLPDALQTSAAINPGNSGGALVNLSGEVIGMPTLAALDPELGGSAAPGIGFAIPSNLVRDIGGQLIDHGGHVINSHRAELGVHIVTVVGPDDQPAGAAVVSVVTGGPAARAGITPGEIITRVGDTPVHTTSDLASALTKHNLGTQVPITLIDGQGHSHTATVTLGQLPGS